METIRTASSAHNGISYRHVPGTEPALLFIHGAGGDSRNFSAQLGGIHGPAMAAVDLPGHGGTAPPAGNGFIDYAEAAAAVADHCGHDRIVPVGHSMGCGAVFELWKLRRPKIAGMVFISAGATLPVNPGVLDLIKNDFGQFGAMASAFCFKPGGDPALCASFRRCMEETGKDTVYNDFLFCSRFDYRDAAAEIDVPVLIIATEKDKMVSRKVIAALNGAVKDSRLAVIPSEGHMPHMDDPDLVNREIERFVKGLE